jgi:hypothetical protein
MLRRVQVPRRTRSVFKDYFSVGFGWHYRLSGGRYWTFGDLFIICLFLGDKWVWISEITILLQSSVNARQVRIIIFEHKFLSFGKIIFLNLFICLKLFFNFLVLLSILRNLIIWEVSKLLSNNFPCLSLLSYLLNSIL